VPLYFLCLFSIDSGLHAWEVACFSWKIENKAFPFILMFSEMICSLILFGSSFAYCVPPIWAPTLGRRGFLFKSENGFKLRLRWARKPLHCRQLQENTAVVAVVMWLQSNLKPWNWRLMPLRIDENLGISLNVACAS